MADLIVQKYGGSSVATLDHIKKIASHVRGYLEQHHKKLVIVVSAMGDQTDELLKMAYQISMHPPKREVDMLLSGGERMTMALLAIALREVDVASVSLTGSQTGIFTSADHGNARIREIKCDRLRAHLEKTDVVIVAGFQGVDPVSKEITTLGRGGSDLTAVALAIELKAEKCELYKDVAGIFSNNPRINSEAKFIEKIDWSEAYELCAAGAQIIHARALRIAHKYQMPIEVRSSFETNSDLKFTKIGNYKMEEPKITALHVKKRQTLFAVKGIDLLQFNQLFADCEHNLLSSEVDSGKWNAKGFIDIGKQHLLPSGSVEAENLSVVTVVGLGLDVQSVLVDKIFAEISGLKVAKLIISAMSLKIFLDEKDEQKLVASIQKLM